MKNVRAIAAQVLLDSGKRFVDEALREHVGVPGMVVPDGNLMAGELGKACQRAHRVLVIVENRDFHISIQLSAFSYNCQPPVQADC